MSADQYPGSEDLDPQFDDDVIEDPGPFPTHEVAVLLFLVVVFAVAAGITVLGFNDLVLEVSGALSAALAGWLLSKLGTVVQDWQHDRLDYADAIAEQAAALEWPIEIELDNDRRHDGGGTGP